METLFPSIKSETSPFLTFLLKATFFIFLFFAFALFFILPIYGIYKRGFDVMLWPSVISFGISFLILIPAFHYYFIKRKKLAKEIIINKDGIFHYNSDQRIIEKILYSDLCSSDELFDVKSVTTRSSGMYPLLEIYVTSEKGGKQMKRLDMNLTLLAVNNKLSLYAHFLQGIHTFRPDLKISPTIFSDYYIEKETWTVNKKVKNKSLFIIFSLAIIICALIFWFVFSFT
ncbi:hypothetical protein [Chryseobacterium sp.]|uniref:hypothetical protein n=1 Tax=Chryseobacterium sp. TaxID=1871047 RepID=UPI002897DEDE|nr:hypothetical protein [Chryseobacterium sp.]